MLLGLKKNLKVNIQDTGYALTFPAGVIQGTERAGNGMLKRLSNGCCDGNNLGDIVDDEVKEYGKGFADGSVKGLASLKRVNF